MADTSYLMSRTVEQCRRSSELLLRYGHNFRVMLNVLCDDSTPL
jgi:hypothetical protein